MISSVVNTNEISQAQRKVRQDRLAEYDIGERLGISVLPLIGMGYLVLSIYLREGANNNAMQGFNSFTSGYLIGGSAATIPFLLWFNSIEGWGRLGPILLGAVVAPLVGVTAGVLMVTNEKFKNAFTYYAAPGIIGAVSLPLFIYTWVY